MSKSNEAIFTMIDDKKDGGMIVKCGLCKGHFDIPNEIVTEVACPHCNQEIHYPEYASF